MAGLSDASIKWATSGPSFTSQLSGTNLSNTLATNGYSPTTYNDVMNKGIYKASTTPAITPMRNSFWNEYDQPVPIAGTSTATPLKTPSVVSNINPENNMQRTWKDQQLYEQSLIKNQQKHSNFLEFLTKGFADA